MMIRQIVRRALSLGLAVVATFGARAAAQPIFTVAFGGARSHPYDVRHISIDLRLDDAKRQVAGSVTHRIRSLASPLRALNLDAAANMTISAVTADGAPTRFRLIGDTLSIILPKPLPYGDSTSIRVDYSVSPKKGLYFIQPDSLVPDRRNQIWTQGQAEDNHFWLPVYDYPNDRSTTEMRATLRGDWKLLSNGRLLDSKPNGDGTTTWHYQIDRDHSSYLIMLAAGEYLVRRDTVAGVPLEYWGYPDQAERIAATFGRTPDIFRYYLDRVGVPYPWSKYSQVAISEFMFGGMENTTATTITDNAYVDRRGAVDYDPDPLVAHELAHQWFGDMVTNRSWFHLWLHEGYATYLASRYRGHRSGEEAFLKEMYDDGLLALDVDKTIGRNPIAGTSGIKTNLYQRGARVLHMLNQLVGDDIFWRASRRFLERNAFGLVETNDLKIAFEDVSGLNLDWFFDEWIFKAGAPEFEVEYRYGRDSLFLRVRQVQRQDSLTGVFRMPLPLEFYLKNRVISDTVWLSRAEEIFTFPMPERPRFVIFDAGDAMLKTVRFSRADDELVAQLDAPRMIDRYLAARELTATTRDRSTASRRSQALRDRFPKERSPYVREEIIRGFATLDSVIAPEVIRLALADSSVEVRRAAIDISYRIVDKRERASLLRPLLSDSSDNVIAAAIEMLSVTAPEEISASLTKLQGVQGRKGRLAEAWLNAVLQSRANGYIDGVIEYTQPKYSRELRSQAYLVLSKLDTVTPAARAAIEQGLRDNSIYIRTSAASAVRARYDDTMRQMLQRLRGELGGEERANVERLIRDDPAATPPPGGSGR